MRIAFLGMNNVASPLAMREVFDKGTKTLLVECSDIVNCDVGDDGSVSRRSGVTQNISGPTAGGVFWSDGRRAFGVDYRGLLSTFSNGVVTAQSGAYMLGQSPEFCAVNDVYVASNGVNVIGVIDGSGFDPIPAVGQMLTENDLEQWVADHYPLDDQGEAVSFATDAFKIGTLAGTCLEFYNGRLYLAVGGFVFCTDTFDVAKMDIRYNVVAGFPDPVTMIKRISTGLYIGTTAATYFLEGGGPQYDPETGKVADYFSQRQVSDCGVIPGTGVMVNAEKIPSLETSGLAPLWTATNGVIVGLPGGVCANLSKDRVDIGVRQRGTAIVRQAGAVTQYLVVLDKLDTWAVNLATLAHSRYSNYGFSSLFDLAGTCYGTRNNRIYRLAGELDDGDPISASITTKSLNFGSDKIKHVPAAFVDLASDDDMSVDLIVDGGDPEEDFPIYCDGLDGAHCLPVKLPRGLRGTHWQFRVNNSSGNNFTLYALNLAAATSQQRIRR